MSMPHSTGHILATYLMDQSIFTIPTAKTSWPLYLGHMPDGEGVEDNCAAIMDTAGIKDGRLLETGENLFKFGVQLMVRCRTRAEGFAKCQEAAEKFETLHNALVTIGTSSYEVDSVSQTMPVLPLGQETGTKRREMFTYNALVMLKAL